MAKKKKKQASGDLTSYVGSIALSKLIHVRMKKKGKKGKKVDCIVIPIKQNHLFEGKEGAVYLPLRIVTRSEEDQYGQHGFISQSVSSEEYKEASDKQKEKFKELPILGNFKNFGAESSSNDSTGSKGEIDEDDDLPF